MKLQGGTKVPENGDAILEDAIPTEEAATEEAVTEEAVTEEAATEEAVTEEAVTEEAVTEEAVTEAAAEAPEAPVEEAVEESAPAPAAVPAPAPKAQPVVEEKDKLSNALTMEDIFEFVGVEVPKGAEISRVPSSLRLAPPKGCVSFLAVAKGKNGAAVSGCHLLLANPVTLEHLRWALVENTHYSCECDCLFTTVILTSDEPVASQIDDGRIKYTPQIVKVTDVDSGILYKIVGKAIFGLICQDIVERPVAPKKSETVKPRKRGLS
ncbi:MAG: hypothetical protein LBC41_00360 [Clostridiales bacterium]|jgi:hypothetical protein|nr:hypothetical protein [Clostridiales bacterium]